MPETHQKHLAHCLIGHKGILFFGYIQMFGNINNPQTSCWGTLPVSCGLGRTKHVLACLLAPEPMLACPMIENLCRPVRLSLGICGYMFRQVYLLCACCVKCFVSVVYPCFSKRCWMNGSFVLDERVICAGWASHQYWMSSPLVLDEKYR